MIGHSMSHEQRKASMTNILVVDDSSCDRLIVREILRAQPNWCLIEAEHGKEALALCEEQLPDLVLTDLQMPHMNGLELLSVLKERHPRLPVVLMTAQGSEEIAVRALREGADSYVPKRIMAQELLDIVERILGLHREQEAFKRLYEHMTRHECHFTLPNDLNLITSLVSFFRQGVAYMRLCDEAEQFRVAVALEEALLNAFYHGNLEVSSKLREIDHRRFAALAEQRCGEYPYKERQIHVSVRLTPDQATFVVRDEGPGFDPSGLPDPTDPENLAKPCGRGVLLMRAFMDEVAYNAQGNEVTLIKRKHSPAAVACEEEELI